MEEAHRRKHRCAGLSKRLAIIDVPGAGKNRNSPVVINGQAALRAGMRKVTQCRIHSGNQEKHADNQEGKCFKKSIHVGYAYLLATL
jgi:hypothetical protein